MHGRWWKRVLVHSTLLLTPCWGCVSLLPHRCGSTSWPSRSVLLRGVCHICLRLKRLFDWCARFLYKCCVCCAVPAPETVSPGQLYLWKDVLQTKLALSSIETMKSVACCRNDFLSHPKNSFHTIRTAENTMLFGKNYVVTSPIGKHAHSFGNRSTPHITFTWISARQINTFSNCANKLDMPEDDWSQEDLYCFLFWRELLF